jgi:hypothetical protein
MSLAMRLLAPYLEEPTATDDGKVPPPLVAEPVKDIATLT